MRYRVRKSLLIETFKQLRRCGRGRYECQALWVSPWKNVSNIKEIAHPRHSGSPIGFNVDDSWIDQFWGHLATINSGIRVQIHTHPGEAYHSSTDDEYPIIHRPGFLSLVIPNFALGPIGFERAYLAEIQQDGTWSKVSIPDRLEII